MLTFNYQIYAVELSKSEGFFFFFHNLSSLKFGRVTGIAARLLVGAEPQASVPVTAHLVMNDL